MGSHSLNTRSRLLSARRRLLLLACIVPMIAVGPSASLGQAATYRGGATIVVKPVGGPPLADVGVVVCRPSLDTGYGGACIPFGPGNAVRVNDQVAGSAVAFQVCLDNDGNSKCGGPPTIPGCLDQQFYSHNDAGAFLNPVGPLPTNFRSGCPGGAFRGYVVFICQGVHIDGITPHTHLARTGSATLTTGGLGFGDFCGAGNGEGGGAAGGGQIANRLIPPKPYYLV